MHSKHHLAACRWLIALGLGISPILTGCSDDYYYAKEEPSADVLGSSIYDYLKADGGFTYFLRLIDDLDYRETLQRTGSKTLFPARDDAFERFFADNPFGVSSYDQLSVAQKKILLNQATVNMAYLSEMLPNVGGTTGPTEDVAIRRATQSVYYDTVAVCRDRALFENRNGQWKRFADRGEIILVEEAPMLVQFTPSVMVSRNITDGDFALLHNGTAYNRTDNDIYINGVKVIERDKICKNGYVHVMAEVLRPLRTMADAISSASDASIFSGIMDRFSAPYYDETATEEIRKNFTGASPNYPAMQVDSVFRKAYFNRLTHTVTPTGERLGDNVLRFDPAQVSYSGSDVSTDMGVMFVPTDRAMRDYYDSPEGKFLKTNYPTWDDVPVALLAKFIQNHQKNSFLTSLPHDWANMNDEKSFPMNVSESDVDHVELCSNGVVYFLNRVIPPVDFRATYAPTLVSDNTSIMKWALLDGETLSDANGMRFFMYLYSMENMYNLIVPTDEAMANYRDPVSWGNSDNVAGREIWEFYYDFTRLNVCARVYGVNPDGTKDLSALKRTITDVDVIRSRFRDILDMHTVVGQMNNGVMSGFLNEGNPGSFVLTKGGSALNINGQGSALTIAGAGDLEENTPHAAITRDANGSPEIFDNDNGRTYFVDRVLHDSRKTVFDAMGDNPDFRAFRDLCVVPDQILNIITEEDDITPIFENKTGSILSVGTIVSFFNNYRYTVFVPTEQAIKDAIAADPELFTWDEIVAGPESQKKIRTQALLKFIRYHFVDNSWYINGLANNPIECYSSARTSFDTFHSVMISRTATSLTVTDETGKSQTVNNTVMNSFNVPAREILYHNKGVERYIDASSHAVLHLVDHALTFRK